MSSNGLSVQPAPSRGPRQQAADGDNVMVFADPTIAPPLLCQGLLERYDADHVRSPRARIARELALVLDA